MRPRFRRRPVTVAVVAVVVLALAARLVLLGERVAHWDEARVAWWVLSFLEYGSYTYHPILHGPFVFHAGRLSFDLLGPSDFAMRLPVAVVGGLLPLSALVLRTRLDDAETVALAVVLAADPLLLYYSRFLRSDVPVAAFSFGTFALLVRAHDTGRARHGVAAAALFAAALASKENAVLYACCWAGAVAFAGVYAERAGTPLRDVGGHATAVGRVARRQASGLASAVGRNPGGLVAGCLATLAVTVCFYAPRGRHEPSLGGALADPSLWPTLLAAATVGAAGKLVDLWLLGGLQGGDVGWHLFKLAGIALVASLPVVSLSAYAVLRERTRGRPLVVVTVTWGVLSVVGYPLAVDIVGGWTGVHVVVPFAIPAAVGLATLARRARPVRASLRGGSPGGSPWDRPGEGDPRARRAALALVVLSAHVVAVGGLSSFVLAGSYYNLVGQPAQGDDALKPTVETAVAVAHDNEGVDVAYFGEYWQRGVHARQPLAWYVRAADYGRSGGERVRTTMVADRAAMPADPPPVVVGYSYDRGTLAELLPGYVCFRHELDYWSPREPGGSPTKAVIFVETGALERYGSTRSTHRCGSSSSASSGRLTGSAHTADVAASPRSSATASKNPRPRSY
jgi:uncharacterized protein (TIGR03663 family)